MYKDLSDSTSVLNEAIANYVSSVRKSNGINKDLTYRDFLSDRMLLVQAIRAGIPYRLFVLIKEESPFTEEEWADFLSISLKSLQRYRAAKDYLFKPNHSEKILEIAEVTELGRSVFNDNEKFLLWLSSPSFALGNLKPVDLIRDSYGKEMVIGELHRIDQAIFA
ncbi:MAG: antitoxin Xre-like helix-turn-helix domain-containing protein [Lentimicrobium sp.]